MGKDPRRAYAPGVRQAPVPLGREPGCFFGRYYIIATLGVGGMAEVHLAYDFLQGEFVAIKFLLPQHARNDRVVARMRREGEIYRLIDHPLVPRVHEIGSAPGIPVFLAMEFVRGLPLGEVLSESGGKLPLTRAMWVVEDVASALHAAHGHQVVHRDVKPDNVVVRKDGRAKLLDFGIARAEDELLLSQKGSIMGTMAYAPPEQRLGRLTDHRADVFSLGAVLYEMLTGQKAIEPGTYQEMAMAETSMLSPPSRLVPGIPPEIDALCMRMLADDVEERTPDMRTVLIDLGLMRADPDSELAQLVWGSREDQRLDAVSRALGRRDIEEAEIEVRRLCDRLSPAIAPDALHLKAEVERARGRQESAIAALELALEYEPHNQEILLDLALLRLAEGRIEPAQDMLRGLPSWMRGGLLVRGILDVLGILARVPGSTLGLLTREGPARGLHEVVLGLA